MSTHGPSATVTAVADAPIAQVWDRFVSIALPDVFPKAKGPIPPVVAVEDQTGRWDAAHETRTVVLGDGMRVTETITLSDPTGGGSPTEQARFGYTVSGFTGPLSFLVAEAQGFWQFDTRRGGTQTEITWRYQFRPTSLVARPLAAAIIVLFWRRYMRDGLENVVRITTQAGPSS